MKKYKKELISKQRGRKKISYSKWCVLNFVGDNSITNIMRALLNKEEVQI